VVVPVGATCRAQIDQAVRAAEDLLAPPEEESAGEACDLSWMTVAGRLYQRTNFPSRGHLPACRKSTGLGGEVVCRWI
jgi:hypothetical protein